MAKATGPGVVPIGDARRISRERSVPLVVIFAIEAGRERFTVTTYGATKAFCRLAADYGNKFADAIMDGTVEAARSEPIEMPDQPTEWTQKQGPR